MKTVFENKYWKICLFNDKTLTITQKDNNKPYDSFIMDINDKILNQKGKIIIINKIQYLAEDSNPADHS